MISCGLRLACVLCALGAAHLVAEFPDEPARELARRISSKLPPRQAVALEVRNLSGLSVEQVTATSRALERALRQRRHALTEKQAGTKVSITLSENTRELVWVAEIRTGDGHDVVMVTAGRPTGSAKDEAAPHLALEKSLLWEQDREILDVAITGEEMIVLEHGALSHCRIAGGQVASCFEIRVPVSWTWPRDLRGRVEIEGRSLRVYFPGLHCTGLMPPSAKMECRESAAPWPVGFDGEMVKGRNFFRAQGLPEFYAAARTRDRNGADLILLADMNGRVRVYDAQMQEAGGWDGWGGEMAAVESECGSGRQVLAALAGAAGDNDGLQAFEIAERKPVAVSPQLEFPGLITALWPPSAGRKALAVSWNPKTDRYAAYSLSVTCSR